MSEDDPTREAAAGPGVRRFAALPWPLRWAAVAGAAWVVVIVAYAIGYLAVSAGRQPGGTTVVDGLLLVVALVLPLILLGLAAWLAEELRRQREIVIALAELTPPLLEALQATRQAIADQPPTVAPGALEAALQAGVASGVATGVDRARAGVDQAIARLTAAEVRLEGMLRSARGAAPGAMPGFAEALAAAPAREAATSAPAAADSAATSPASPTASASAPPRATVVPEAREAKSGRPSLGADPARTPAARPAGAEASTASAAAAPGEGSSRGHAAAAGHSSPPGIHDGEADTRPEWQDLVRALDFPRDEADHGGFRALREALRHPSVAQMLQSAEDVLTILAGRGIFLDEITPDPVDPEAWRRFQAGRRGPEADAVGGIREPGLVAEVQALGRNDPIFRDAALFFQRRFDKVLAEFLPGATDAQIAALADTRSGRAFMLLARTSGAIGSGGG